MSNFKNISVEEAKELLRADNYLIDIRDKESFSISHVFNKARSGYLQCTISSMQ